MGERWECILWVSQGTKVLASELPLQCVWSWGIKKCIGAGTLTIVHEAEVSTLWKKKNKKMKQFILKYRISEQLCTPNSVRVWWGVLAGTMKCSSSDLQIIMALPSFHIISLLCCFVGRWARVFWRLIIFLWHFIKISTYGCHKSAQFKLNNT